MRAIQPQTLRAALAPIGGRMAPANCPDSSDRWAANPQNRTPSPSSSSSSILSVQSVRGKLRHDAFHAANHAATCRVLPQKAEGEEGKRKSANCEYQPTTGGRTWAENARRCREIRSFVSVRKLSVQVAGGANSACEQGIFAATMPQPCRTSSHRLTPHAAIIWKRRRARQADRHEKGPSRRCRSACCLASSHALQGQAFAARRQTIALSSPAPDHEPGSRPRSPHMPQSERSRAKARE